MEVGTYSGRHIQWAGGMYWAGSRWVNGEAGRVGLGFRQQGQGQHGTQQGRRRTGSIGGGSQRMGSHGSVLLGESQWHAAGWRM